MNLSIILNYFNPRRDSYLQGMAGFALESLRHWTPHAEILCSDGSGVVSDAMAECCRRCSVEYLPSDEKERFADTYNRGVRAGTRDVVVLCASDVLVSQGWAEEMLRLLDRTGAAMICPYVSASDYIAQCYHAVPRRTLFTPCAATINLNAVRRDVWESVGSLDPAFSGNYNDVDYLIRLRQAGQLALIADCGPISHLGSVTLSIATLVNAQADAAVFGKKHPEFAANGYWHKCWHPLLCRSVLLRQMLAWTCRVVPARKRYDRIVDLLRFEPVFHRVSERDAALAGSAAGVSSSRSENVQVAR